MTRETTEELKAEIAQLKANLEEATDMLEAIRTGQVDALVVQDDDGHSLYTIQSADLAYRVFVEQMTEGAVTLNPGGLILYCNSRFAAMVGQPTSKILGNPFTHFVNARDTESFKGLFQRAWRENARQEILMGDSKPIPVLLSLNVLKPYGEITLSMIVTDLTAQKKTEEVLKSKNEQLEVLNEALLSSNHDLQQFASVASHDLQEPLRKIQVYSKFLKDTNFDQLSNDSKKFIDKIISASMRMKTLIVDILTYSRLSAEEQEIGLIDLKDLIQEILEDFDLKIAEKHARIDVENLPVVEGNRGQLRQVFYNIINNALKFIAADRKPYIQIINKKINPAELGLSLADDLDYCCVGIHDNGIGFDERFAHSIFSLFEKLNPKSAFEGSGIGLSIAKKIIDKHHGFIIAKSVIGQGSEFNIILPYKHKNRNDG